MAVKATMAFVDTTGQASRVIAYTADQAAANTLSAAIAAASNAGQRNVDGITVTIHTGAATAADYFDVEDKASLVFKAADGSTHKYQIPAPVTAMFDPADQETVLHSDPTGVIAAFIAGGLAYTGSALTTFIAGKRLRRRSRRG